MGGPHHRRAALVSVGLLTLMGVCGCSHHAAPQPVRRAVTVGVNGRIGPLRVDVSNRHDVISFAGRPDAERHARTDRNAFARNIPYDALGYGCGANAGANALPLVHGGPRCRTVFFLDRFGRLGLFYTTHARYLEAHGVRIAMPTAQAERLLKQRLHVGCVAAIHLSSPRATLTVMFDGGTIRRDGTVRGGHVSELLLHGLHDDIGLFECE